MNINLERFRKIRPFFLLIFGGCGLSISLFLHLTNRIIFSPWHTVVFPLGYSLLLGSVCYLSVQALIFSAPKRRISAKSLPTGKDDNLLLDFALPQRFKAKARAKQETPAKQKAIAKPSQPFQPFKPSLPESSLLPEKVAAETKKKLGQIGSQGDLGDKGRGFQPAPIGKVVGAVRQVMRDETES